MDLYPSSYEADSAGSPTLPLREAGEGDTPALFLPNPNTPVIPLPNPGEGGSADSYPTEDGFPITLLPNPGEGGPVDSGSIYPSRPGQTIVILPQLLPPCFFCGINTRSGSVRFLNAVHNNLPVSVYINNRLITRSLGFSSITSYGRVADGFQTVTIAAPNGYVFVQKSMPFRSNEKVTVAIIQTPSGMDLLQISDTPCSKPAYMSCFRASNLAYNSPPLDVILYDGRVVFSDVTYKETTDFKRIRPGNYDFYLARTNLRPMPRDVDIETLDSATPRIPVPTALVSFNVQVRRNSMCTVYIMNYENKPSAIQTMIVEDQLN